MLAGLLYVSLAQAQNKVGINTNSPLETLDVNGNTNLRGLIKLSGNSGASGQVLTSKGAGNNPVWSSIALSGGGRFWATINNNSKSSGSSSGRALWDLNADVTQEDSVDFATAIVTGTDITVNSSGLTNNFIVINKTGLYHFEGTMRLFVTNPIGVTMKPRGFIKIIANRPAGTDVDLFLVEEVMPLTGDASTGAPTQQFNLLAKFSIDIHLEMNTTVSFETGFNLLRFTQPLLAIGVSSGGSLSGYFVAE